MKNPKKIVEKIKKRLREPKKPDTTPSSRFEAVDYNRYMCSVIETEEKILTKELKIATEIKKCAGNLIMGIAVGETQERVSQRLSDVNTLLSKLSVLVHKRATLEFLQEFYSREVGQKNGVPQKIEDLI